jgi:hypothetical protein
MFFEAATMNNLSFDNLNKENCYSFVLQHPENRIVVPFITPQLYLIAIYSIQTENNIITVNVRNTKEYKYVYSNSPEYQYFVGNNFKCNVKYPKVYSLNTYSDLILKYASMNTSYDVVGVMIHNKLTGERTKVRNPVYEQVKHLRGNQPKIQYQYLCLKQRNLVGQFLKFYPEHRRIFLNYKTQLYIFTKTLFLNYISCFVKKEKHLVDFSKQFRPHMYNIHQEYLKTQRTTLKKFFINFQFVEKYVNKMNPSFLMYCLNYQFRNRTTDIKYLSQYNT